jgi:uncharacterized membrane protein YebE (DUF533 family)
MKQKFLLATICFLFFATTNAQVNKRQQNQRSRTKQGVQSGEITKHEAKRIHTQQKHVQHMETKAKSDGVVTRKEKAKLNVAQNHASRSIYRKKHNKRDRN